MLACSDARLLVLDSSEPHRLAPSDGAAVGAGDLTVITRGADADFPSAAHAAEQPRLLIDHRTRAGDISGHGRGVERWSTSERRLDHRDDPEGSGRLPRAFALSAARSGYLTPRPPPTIRPTVPRPLDLPVPIVDLLGGRIVLDRTSARRTVPVHKLSTSGHRLPVSPPRPPSGHLHPSELLLPHETPLRPRRLDLGDPGARRQSRIEEPRQAMGTGPRRSR
jgi:hypothetical protein